jgi:hypothetical protein
MQIARMSLKKTNVLFMSDEELNLLVDLIESDEYYIERDEKNIEMEDTIREYFKHTDGLKRT